MNPFEQHKFSPSSVGRLMASLEKITEIQLSKLDALDKRKSAGEKPLTEKMELELQGLIALLSEKFGSAKEHYNKADSNDIYVKYHDEEWGVPVRDDKAQFEFLTLESYLFNKHNNAHIINKYEHHQYIIMRNLISFYV